MHDHRPWRRLGALLALLALVGLLAGCGSDDEGGSAAGDAETETTEPTEAGPVTIEHHYGETVLDEVPEKVVALDLQWTDVLVSLGVQPIAFADNGPSAGEGGRYPWQTELSADAQALPGLDTGEVPFEQIAALQPDLIVVTYLATEQETYDKLSQIAPTIPMLGDAQVDPWQDIAEAAGTIFHKEDEAAELIADVEAEQSRVADELPGLAGKTYTLAQYIAGDAIYTVADPEDGSSRFFDALGLVMHPDVVAAGESQGEARPTFSPEEADILSADVVAFFTAVPEADIPKELPAWKDLPAVQSGAMALMDFPTIVALNTPTPISIPYAIEELRPHLEKAAG